MVPKAYDVHCDGSPLRPGHDRSMSGHQVGTTQQSAVRDESEPTGERSSQATRSDQFLTLGGIPEVSADEMTRPGQTASTLAFEANRGGRTLPSKGWEGADVIEATLLAISQDPTDERIQDQVGALTNGIRAYGLDTGWVPNFLWNFTKAVHRDDARAKGWYKDNDCPAAFAAGAVPSVAWARDQVMPPRIGNWRAKARKNRPTFEADREYKRQQTEIEREDRENGGASVTPVTDRRRRQAEAASRARAEALAEEPGLIDSLLKMSFILEQVPVAETGQNAVKAARDVASSIKKLRSGEGNIEDVVHAASRLGRAVANSVGVLATFLAEGGGEASRLLFDTAKVLAIPGSVFNIVDNVNILLTGHHLSGKKASDRDTYYALFQIGRDLKRTVDGVAVLAKLAPRLGPFFEAAASRLGWANPIAFGFLVSYEEIKFLAANVYGPTHVHMTQFLTSLRTGGDPDSIIAAIERRPDDRDTVIDLAPVFTGATGKQFDYLYGNGSIFGQGVTGWGWLQNWTLFWDQNVRAGQLTRFLHDRIAADPGPYFPEIARVAKKLAITFIENEERAGRIGNR